MLGLANWWIEEKIKIYQCVGNGKESDIKENTQLCNLLFMRSLKHF